MSHQSLSVGDPVPDFTLPDQEGKAVSLRELLVSGCLVLYFYPKDDTPGCTAEACSFRDEHQQLAEAGACVVGVSSDDVESHRRFAEKHRLPFRLLSDRGGELRRRFGVPKTLGLLDGRVTYVIDSQGIVLHVFSQRAHVAGRDAGRAREATPAHSHLGGRRHPRAGGRGRRRRGCARG